MRYAIRTLVRSPAYTTVAVAVLALGIGAIATMFAVVNGVLLKPLPYAESDRLVRIYQASAPRSIDDGAVSPVDFRDWREQARAFDGIAAYWSGVYTVTGRGDPTEIRAAFVTQDFFPLLRAPVITGRPLTADDHRDVAPVAVVSERLARTQFGDADAAIGRPITIGRTTATVVGVAPAALRLPTADNDAWLPQSLITAESHGPQDARGNRYLEAVGRLAPGVDAESAQADLSTIAARLAVDHPDSNGGWTTATVIPLHAAVVGPVDRPLLVMLGVVVFVLLIGCANLANLMLARAVGRTREFAVRTALGAGKWRLARQLSAEALVLAAAGTAAGLALAAGGIHAIVVLSADTLPRIEDIALDGLTAAVAVVSALAATLIIGLLPALRLSGSAPAIGLRGGRGTLGAPRSRLRDALVVVQVTLAVLLVIGAGLMIRSYSALNAVDPGFAPERVLTVTMSLPADDGDDARRSGLTARKQQITARLAALPGVTAVGTIHRLPLQGVGEAIEFTRADGGPSAEAVRADARFVNDGYFAAMGVPLRAGAVFDDTRPAETPSIVVSEAVARRLWPEGDAVGRRVSFGGRLELEVIGVVGDVRQFELSAEPQPAAYIEQARAPRSAVSFVIRTDGDPAPLAASVRRVIAELEPSRPIRSVVTLEGVISESLARDRFFTLLFAAFGALALLLAAVGLYGVLAYAVGQRTQEIGVRIALGARRADVMRMVLRAGVALAAVGLVVGLGVAFGVSRAMEGLLYGIAPNDPLTFIAVPLVLLAVALAAAWVPARRAVRIDPMEALRDE